MSTDRIIQLSAYHPGQAKVDAGLRRFNVLACGRRWGKDIYEMNKSAEMALEGYPVGFAAPTYKVLADNWREVNFLLAPVIKHRNTQERRLELYTGGVIDFWSLDNPDMIRGRKYKRFTINEAGYVSDLLDTWNYIIRPTLIDYEGDLIVGGTPKGRNGFWRMFQWGQDDEKPEWACWQMSSYENPHVPAHELDAMVATIPEMVVQQEIYAKFLEDAGGVFRRVMAAATAEEQEVPTSGHNYVIGVDWGQMNDFTVLTVLDTTTKEVCYIDRFNQIDYVIQADRLAALANRFKPNGIIAESNSMGLPIIQQLQRRGVAVQPFQTTNASKDEAVRALQLAFEQGEIKIIADDILVGELQAYESKRLPSGLLRYAAPEGMHDDTVMSLAIAWQAVAQQVRVVFGG